MIQIANIYFKLGNKKEGNSLIEKNFGIRKNSLKKLTGIGTRFISDTKQTTENIALDVCKKMKKNEKKKITHIIGVTNTPSIMFPGISNYIASFLDIENVHCLNLNAGCTGYVDALILSHEIIKNNKKANILIITSDTYSKYIKKNNKNIRPLFSDGASASIIKHSKNGFKIIKKINKNLKNTQNNLIFKGKFIEMNGPSLVSFVAKYVSPTIINNSKNINAIYLHQAGKIVTNLIKRSLKNIFIPTNYQKYGNLVSTSIPVLIRENFVNFKKSKEIIICGFGVGISMSLIKLKR